MRTPKAATRVKILRFATWPLCLFGIAVGIGTGSALPIVFGVLGIAFAVLGTRSARTGK